MVPRREKRSDSSVGIPHSSLSGFRREDQGVYFDRHSNADRVATASKLSLPTAPPATRSHLARTNCRTMKRTVPRPAATTVAAAEAERMRLPPRRACVERVVGKRSRFFFFSQSPERNGIGFATVHPRFSGTHGERNALSSPASLSLSLALDLLTLGVPSCIRYANHSGNPNLVVELRPVQRDGPAASGAAAAVDIVDGKEAGVALTTLRDVEEGEELTFDYGDE